MLMRLKIMPPAILMIFLLLTVGSHFVLSTKKIIVQPYNYLGGILIIISLVFIIWPDEIFKKENTTIKPYEQPNKLITTGPFKISRHPTYLGMLLLLFGAAIIAGSIAPFIFPIIFTVIIDTCFIRYEEQNLERIFKGAYRQYKRNVRRWI